MIVETHPGCQAPTCSAYRFRARGIRHQPPPQAGTLDRTEKSATLAGTSVGTVSRSTYEFFTVGSFSSALFDALSRVAVSYRILV